jgi:hypothetical protein
LFKLIKCFIYLRCTFFLNFFVLLFIVKKLVTLLLSMFLDSFVPAQWVCRLCCRLRAALFYMFNCRSFSLICNTSTIKLHADGNITCKTHWTIQCSRMLKYSIIFRLYMEQVINPSASREQIRLAYKGRIAVTLHSLG